MVKAFKKSAELCLYLFLVCITSDVDKGIRDVPIVNHKEGKHCDCRVGERLLYLGVQLKSLQTDRTYQSQFEEQLKDKTRWLVPVERRLELLDLQP